MENLCNYQNDRQNDKKSDKQRCLLLEEKLRKAEKECLSKSVFLNSLSHDIRTPINAIIGYTDLAKAHLEDDKKVKGYLTKISVASENLLGLVNDILTMSSIEAGALVKADKSEDLLKIINDLVTITESFSISKKIDFYVNTDNVINKSVICDKNKINKILTNIISNAIKYTNPGGTVSLIVKQTTTAKSETKNMGCNNLTRNLNQTYKLCNYEFRIKDTGVGMSSEFQKQIYNVFSREQKNIENGIEGVGFGMVIVKKLVEFLGGDISFTSEENKGTEFVVNLPLKIDMRTDSESGGLADDINSFDNVNADNSTFNKLTEKSGEYEKLSGIRILVVEDDEMNRELTGELLEDLGMIVSTVPNGKSAISVLEAEYEAFDIILMDIKMPDMDGIEATKFIRSMKNKKFADIPIIAFSAKSFEEDKKLALTVGMNAYISKPVDMNKLADKILEVIK